ncbi:hypothetical protein COOONC_22218 [Cooperia oncophora]
MLPMLSSFHTLIALLASISLVNACHPQFEKELRYLDLYLGVRPDNDGVIPSKDSSKFASYITSPEELNCDLESECLWKNAPSDNLLDTSDFWYFKVCFGMNLRCGSRKCQNASGSNPAWSSGDIALGSHLLIAGNTSVVADSATLVSAPIACQRKPGAFPSIFGSKPLLPKSPKPIQKLSDLDCAHPQKKCRYPPPTKTTQTSSFLFLAVDALAPRRYATLRSDLIPCTQATTTLSMKYWLKAGTQVEICAIDVDGIRLSCGYLSEEDSPGPIEIDVDAYHRPYRVCL